MALLAGKGPCFPPGDLIHQAHQPPGLCGSSATLPFINYFRRLRSFVQRIKNEVIYNLGFVSLGGCVLPLTRGSWVFPRSQVEASLRPLPGTRLPSGKGLPSGPCGLGCLLPSSLPARSQGDAELQASPPECLDASTFPRPSSRHLRGVGSVAELLPVPEKQPEAPPLRALSFPSTSARSRSPAGPADLLRTQGCKLPKQSYLY